ncbi:MAG: trimethylamine methyltransferase family protein [Thermoplasmata archaeon]
MEPEFRVLSDEEIHRIDAASLDILSGTGIKIMNHEALLALKSAGASINEHTEIVKIPEDVIREALGSAPRRVVLFGRDRSNDVDLSGIERPYLTTDGTAMYVVDFSTGAYRRGTTRDLFRCALISDYLEEISVFWPMVVASDVSDAEHTVHEFSTSILGTSKHIQHEAHGSLEAQAEVKIGSAIAGGPEELRKRPLFSSVFTPVSPLAFEKDSTDSMMLFAKAGIPIVAMSIIQSGYTGPRTLAGSLAVMNSEILASLVLAQATESGSPFIYGIFAGPFDLDISSFMAGSPELALLSAAGAQMAAYYGLPSLASGMLTNAKTISARAAFEKVQTGMLPALSGASLVSGIGGLCCDEAISYEQLLIDCDIWTSIRRILRGLRTDQDLIGVDLIDRLGPMADYLSEVDSVRFPKEDISRPRLLQVADKEEAKSKGARDLEEIAHEEVRKILSNHRTSPLDRSVEREVVRITKEFRRSVAHLDIE